MKKNFLVLIMVLATVSLFVGCGRADTEKETKDKDVTDSDITLPEIAEDYDPNDPADVEKMMESYAEYGAKVELEEFAKTEAVDAPDYFPTDLIYTEGKITGSSDYGDESYINKSITIQTTDDLKTAKAFYKDLFSQLTWTLVSQSNESDSASYEATDSAAIGASVYIYASPYSKLVSIDVTYSGYITE